MITWSDLAEQQEMLAKAWTCRASADTTPRLRRATLDDAAEAAATAADYRRAGKAGAPLHPGLAAFLMVVP